MPTRDPTSGRQASGPTAGQASGAATATDSPRLWLAMTAMLVVTTLAACLTLVWDSDIFWHLASGYWMLRHGQVLGIDPFSIDPEPRWVNVQWLFQWIIASLHSLGGFAALSVLKAGLAACTLAAFCLALRRRVTPILIGICGLAVLVTIAGRVRVRPEAFTLLYIMLTIVLLDGARRGDGTRRLWWMTPIMLAWVNMHGLYILGLGLMWSAVAGALIDRVLRRADLSSPMLSQRAIVPLLAASMVCFVTPWPLETLTQPFLLWTRISGQNEYYTYVVSELQPTYLAWRLFIGPLALAGVTAAAMLINLRRLSAVHVFWLVPFVGLALLAKRNVALLGPMCGYLLACHAQAIIGPILARRGSLVRLMPIAAALVVLLGVFMAACYATERTFRREAAPFRFGLGLAANEFPIEMARFLADFPGQGDILVDNFGDAGAFLYYGPHSPLQPRRLMYMDGRLEAHSLERFISQHKIHLELQKPQSAADVKLPPSVRFVIVSHGAATTLSACSRATMENRRKRFRLLYVDTVAACFEDTQWGLRHATSEQENSNLKDFDRPLAPDGFVATLPRATRTWWRQNPVSLNYQLGQMLVYMGQYDQADQPGVAYSPRYECTLLAGRYLAAARNEGAMAPTVADGMLAQAFQQLAYQNYYVPSASLPVDMDAAEALCLYRLIDLNNLGDENVRKFAEQYVRTMLVASQYDAVAKAMESFMDHLPPRIRISPPAEYFDLRNNISMKLKDSRDRAADRTRGLDLAGRINVYLSPNVGLIDQAIQEVLSATDRNGALQLNLGDLLLRKGLVAEAREAYAAVGPNDAAAWQLAMRRALCDWVEGKLHQAAGQLRALADTSGQAVVKFYLADLEELIGDYPAATAAMADIKTDDAELARLVARLQQRLLDKTPLTTTPPPTTRPAADEQVPFKIPTTIPASSPMPPATRTRSPG